MPNTHEPIQKKTSLRLSRTLLAQASDIWNFRASWCRFVETHNDNRSHKNHKHSLYEMQYVMRGSLSIFFADGEAHVIMPHQFVIIPPQTSHHLQFHEPHTQKLVVGFTAHSENEHILRALDGTAALRILDASEALRHLVQALFQKSDEALAITAYVSVFLLQSIVLEALEIEQPFEQLTPGKWMKQSVDDVRLDQLHQYITENICSPITGAEVSARLCISQRHLNRLCTAAYGCTVSRLIQKMRVHHAQKLLEESSLSLADIAESMAYSSVYAFIRSYKTIYGTTPGKYQKDVSLR